MPKKPSKPAKPITFTIRQIEDIHPCSHGYFEWLSLIKGRPIPDGPYAGELSSRGRSLPKKSRYAPDDPIALADMLSVATYKQKTWLIEHFVPARLRGQIYKRECEIRAEAYTQAAEEILAPPQPKKLPRGNPK